MNITKIDAKGKSIIMEIVKNILLIISILFIVWLVASFIDVNINNISDYDYSSWNLFKIFFS